MNNLELLIDSVKKKKSISFEYNKPGKTSGKRFGNVHAIFIFTAKIGTQSTKLHIVQTAGVSDSKLTNPFPDFRMFNIGDISNIEILSNEPDFEIFNEKYNPEWIGYDNPLAKV